MFEQLRILINNKSCTKCKQANSCYTKHELFRLFNRNNIDEKHRQSFYKLMAFKCARYSCTK